MASRPSNIRRVLGIDPGLSSTGYAVVDFSDGRYRLAAHGVIATSKDMAMGERLSAIYDGISRVISDYAPQEAGMESLFFSRNVSSALDVSQARGALSLCLFQRGVPLTEYTPNTIKKAVSGSARAGKDTVREFVKILLGLDAAPKTDHEADAIGCAIAHINYSPQVIFRKNIHQTS